ncbi:MAG TPA: NAD(P)H-dependent glycerol-3-phosphate dehydrogenase [Acidimicrobiales bacterium]|nr:NAD(P)H-dependent glycerol-3-phosphate dehydrogenase [Acidimicrobiales bacterium]
MRVTVLGAGSWGTTVAVLASRKNKTVLWARHPEVAEEIRNNHTNSTYLPGFTLPEQLAATSDLEEAATAAELLLVGVPSHGFRDVVCRARPYIHPWIPVVSLAKGLEAGSLLRMTQVIKELLSGHPAAALTGPNLAKEIMSGQAAAGVIATEDLSVAVALQQVLRSGLFRLYVNHDVIGCEVGGALKNVIAIAAGMAQGLGVGDNTRAAVIARGLAELTRLGVAMGGEAATFAGLTGMGDLVATCMSPLSRNRHVGEQLGMGRKLDDILAEMHTVAEGLNTARTVMELAGRYGIEMPICQEVSRVVAGEITGLDAYRGLQIPPGHESDPG